MDAREELKKEAQELIAEKRRLRAAFDALTPEQQETWRRLLERDQLLTDFVEEQLQKMLRGEVPIEEAKRVLAMCAVEMERTHARDVERVQRGESLTEEQEH